MPNLENQSNNVFSLLRLRIHELESGKIGSRIQIQNQYLVIENLELFAIRNPKVCQPLLEEELKNLNKAYSTYKSKVPFEDMYQLTLDDTGAEPTNSPSDWDILLLELEDEISEYRYGLEKLIDKLNNPVINSCQPKKIKSFKWLQTYSDNSTLEELEALFNNLQDKILDTDLETFKKAFSGEIITSLLNIKWIKKPSKNKTTPDYSSIFNFLQALIDEGKLEIVLNLKIKGSKVGPDLYTQVGNIFCHKDEKSFFPDSGERNINIRNYKKKAQDYSQKTIEFQTIIQSLKK